MSKPKISNAKLGARVLNPWTPGLRAKSIPSKKAVARKAACRGKTSVDG